MSEHLARAIARALGNSLGEDIRIVQMRPAGGGCIHRALCAEDARGRRWFVKINRRNARRMFETELMGLRALRGAAAVRVPEPVACGDDGGTAFLVCEWLDLRPLSEDAEEVLGEQLAALHRCTNEAFGFDADNFIGSTPQPNGWMEDWCAFWRERRLAPQLALARENGFGGRLQTLGERLMARLNALLAGHAPQPSLLHGDLWSGNAAACGDVPVIFDPAAYYGDREADLAMTELFGGFGPRFYAAYRAAWPLDAGYELRRELYKLYHVLNHANLFGGGYAAQAERMMARLLAAC